jgi:hypothetical protein
MYTQVISSDLGKLFQTPSATTTAAMSPTLIECAAYQEQAIEPVLRDDTTLPLFIPSITAIPVRSLESFHP